MFLKYFLPACCITVIAFAIISCKKNVLYASEPDPLNSGQAQTKVIFASMYQKNPAYQISINGTRVSNLLGGTAATTNPTPFPGGGLNAGGGSTPDYLGVIAGQNTFSIATPKVGTNTDSAVLASAGTMFTAGKKYSVFFTDTLAKTQTVVVEDSLSQPDSGFVKFRFVNLMPDVTALDLYIGTVKIAEAANIPFKGVSAPFTLPTNNASTVWAIRTAGGTANLITYTSASTLANQRIFTVFARGYNAVTATSDYRRRAISFIYVR